MSNVTDHPTRLLGVIPLIVSAGALFIFFSGFYVHGLSFGLGMNVHQHLTVSDYARIAIAVGSNPLLFIPVLFLVRFITLAQEDQGSAEEQQLGSSTSTPGSGWMLAIVNGLAIALIVLPPLLSLQRFPEALLIVLSLLTAILAVVVIVAFAMAMLRGAQPGKADHGVQRDERAVRTRSMRTMGAVGAGLAVTSLWALDLLSIHPELGRFAVLDLLAWPSLLVGASMIWISLIDRTYGYKPLRGLSSNLVRTILSLAPAVLFVYWYIGFHDARKLLHDDTGSITVSTRTAGPMEVDSYRNFETWLLARTGGRDDMRFLWIPVRTSDVVTLRSTE